MVQTRGMLKRDEIIAFMLLHYNYDGEKTITVNGKLWTLADLFIRQYLNNMCDGFGLRGVYDVYHYLVSNKDYLIRYNLVSKDGFNNSGYQLWNDYNFEL